MRVGMRQAGNRLAGDDSGAVVAIFALALIPLAGLMGAAVDYSRATQSQAKMQAAADAAALAVAAAAPARTDAQLLNDAKQVFSSLLPGASPGVTSVSVSPGRTQVSVFATTHYYTQFFRLPGYEHITIDVMATSVVANTNYEIALVLDNSGSMASSAGGSSKIQAAKNAANQLVTAMFSTPASAARTKVALVPFTLAVNVGSQYANAGWIDRTGVSSIHWQNTNWASSSWKPQSRFDIFSQLGVTWAGCVESRPGTWGTTDAPTAAGSGDSYFVPMFAPDEPGDRGSSYYSYSTIVNGRRTTVYYTYPNSYIDDDGGSCTGGSPSADQVDTLQDRLCKYKNRPSLSTSNGRGPNFECDARPLMRLTSDQSSITSAINAMQAGGNTNLFEGFMWGWRTLSPNGPFGDGRAYNTPDTKKVIIMLTDGMNAWNSQTNHNKSVYSPFGYYTDKRLSTTAPTDAASARAQIDAKTLTACTNAKEQGIQVYTVGFSVATDPIDSGGLSLLQQCASTPQMAYVANNSTDIVTVFREIAQQIGSQRLTQ